MNANFENRIVGELLRDVIGEHSNPESPEYRECEDSPCRWCLKAQVVLDGTYRSFDDVVETRLCLLEDEVEALRNELRAVHGDVDALKGEPIE